MAKQKENDELVKLLQTFQAKGKKAKESDLDDLQGILSTVMAAQVEYTEEVITYDADGAAVLTGEQRYTATPALLGIIEKFLKNNSIISDISTNENTETLQKEERA